MSNLYILSEERPKKSVIKQLLILAQSKINNLKSSKKIENTDNNLIIRPEFIENKFTFNYIIEGIKLEGIQKIIIKLSKGTSSFIDFLIFMQEEEPIHNKKNNLIFAVEETKTRDSESRNTGVYQRATKFVFFEYFYPNVPIYMLYNDSNKDTDKKPSDTSIFGTNMYKILGVDLIGKNDKWFNPFKSIDKLINFKNSMRKPPNNNTPIVIQKFLNCIKISGRLEKPIGKGNIGHDPNIGALALISSTIRKLGWNKEITIIDHGVTQKYVDKNFRNKFLRICAILNINLENIDLDYQKIKSNMPYNYWKYEESSEKVADIFLHLLCDYYDIATIYENHAGSERGYFITSNNENIVLPKKDKNKNLYYIPDVIIKNDEFRELLLIEGKVYNKWKDGVKELYNYDNLEEDYIFKYYKDYNITRWVTLYSSTSKNDLPHEKVLLVLNNKGEINLNKEAPKWLNLIIRNIKR